MQWGMMLHCQGWQCHRNATHRFLKVITVASVAETQVALAAFTKGGARSKAHIGLLDEAHGDVPRVAAGMNLEEGVECAGWKWEVDETGRGQLGDDVTALPCARDLMRDEILTLLESSHAGALNECRGAGRRILHEVFDDL